MVCFNNWDDELLLRISIDPGIFGGRPTIRDTKLPVDTVVRRLLAGADPDGLLRLHPALTRDDLAACLLCARVMRLPGSGA